MMEVLEVPATNTAPTTPNGFDEFLQTGRTGRRNAVPEVVPGEGGPEATSSSAAQGAGASATALGDLPGALEKLNFNDGEASTSDQPCSSSQGSSEICTTDATATISGEDEQCRSDGAMGDAPAEPEHT